MSIPTLEQMLAAGIHFGHQKGRWNPKMRKYIFMERNGIHIIDLKKTQKLLEDAANLVAKTVASGKSVLFVSTKKQGKECIKENAVRCGQPYVTERWMGGMLTNFQTISKNIKTLELLEQEEREGYVSSIKKKEILRKERHKKKLQRDLTGIRNMGKLPGVIIVVDIKKEHIAVCEARKLKIPCIGIVDTNCDPTEVDYPIPGNDDAIKSIGIIISTLADFVLLGAEGQVKYQEEQKLALEKQAEEEKISGEKADTTEVPAKKTEVKKTPAKKTPPKKAEVKKTPATKTAPKKAEIKKTEVKETPATKTAPKKAEVKKTPATKTAPKKAEIKKTPATKTAPKKAEIKKTEVKKTPEKKTEPKKTEVKKTPAKKTEPKKTEVKKTPAKKTEPKKAETKEVPIKKVAEKKIEGKEATKTDAAKDRKETEE